MEPSKVVICKICSQSVPAYLSIKSKAKKERKWEDINGRFFNGKTCPDCHAKNMVIRQREYVKQV